MNTRLHEFPAFTPRAMHKFLAHLAEAQTRSNDKGCHIWKRSTTGFDDYGEDYCHFWEDGAGGSAHRLSYLYINKTIEPGLLIRHTCDVKGCVRPDHLLPGTALDNARDAKLRSRRAPVVGEANGRAVLTEEEVVFIVHQCGLTTDLKTIADRVYDAFGTTHKLANIKNVVEGKTWKALLKRLGHPTAPTTRRKVKKLDKSVAFSARYLSKFWAQVKKTDQCWVWTGCRHKNKNKKNNFGEYGLFYWGGRNLYAHVASFRIANDRWPTPGLELSHNCRNTLCVRPDHLDELTRRQHVTFASAQGWLSEGHKGQRNRCKLSDSQIEQIKILLRDAPKLTDARIRDRVAPGVTTACIADIRKGKTGGHVVVQGFEPRRKVGGSLRYVSPLNEADTAALRKRFGDGESASSVARAFKITLRDVYALCVGVRDATEQELSEFLHYLKEEEARIGVV